MASVYVVGPALAIALFIFFKECEKYYKSRKWRPLATKDIEAPPSPALSAKEKMPLAVPSPNDEILQQDEVAFLQTMFTKLHNLEQNVNVIPEARDLLLSLLAGAVNRGMQTPATGLLSLERYTPDAFISQLQALEGAVAVQWDAYNERRRAGQPRELLRTRDEAKHWLQNQAPLRCVDGAWLGYINKITTPFPLRASTKVLWQVMSEELGDGDLDKNHVHLFNQLLREVGSDLPDAHDPDFVHPRHWNGEDGTGSIAGSMGNWRAGVSQLLISLFPHDMLPEILGFNLQFEAMTLNTLRAARELKELRIDSLYFLLHVTIDNSHSGHLAMAREAVTRYLDTVQRLEGPEAVQRAWKRVQAGYALSEHSGDVVVLSQSSQAQWPGEQGLAKQVGKMFADKALAADGLHCRCRAKVGRRTLRAWLESDVIIHEDQQREFLEDLSKSTPWIKKGDPDGSKLIQELYWGGKMFGSFTQGEVDLVKAWILSLDGLNTTGAGNRALAASDMYWQFTGRARNDLPCLAAAQDIRTNHPVMPIQTHASACEDFTQALVTHLPTIEKKDLPKILPLWFAQQCLLEGFVAVPAKTTNQLHSAVLRALRAQYGFDVEKDIVDGMDEVNRGDQHLGIVEVGLQLASFCDKAAVETQFSSLSQVLLKFPNPFADEILSLAAWPERNTSMLLGMSSAFVELQEAVVMSGLLGEATADVMKLQIGRQIAALAAAKGYVTDQARFTRGFNLAKVKILEAFA